MTNVGNIEYAYENGRSVGYLENQFQKIQMESVFSDAAKKEQCFEDMQRIREDINSIPKPSGLVEKLAYFVGTIRG